VIASIAGTHGRSATSAQNGWSIERLKVQHGCGDTRDRVLDFVGAEKRVLELGCTTGSLAHDLHLKGCQTVAVTDDRAVASQIAPHCERVIVGDLDRLDLSGELSEDRFDVVVAPDVLGRLKEPESILRIAKGALKPGGSLIVSVQNVAHGSVRLALWCGQFPYDDRGVLNRAHLRFFTRDTLIRMLEETGFAVGRIESSERPILDSDVPPGISSLPAGLLESLQQDPQAQIDRFVLVAHPIPLAGLQWVQHCLRESAEQTETATAEAAQLRRIVDAMETQIASLYRRAEHLAQREAETRAELLSAHDELARQSEDFRTWTRELVAQRDLLIAQRDELVAQIERFRRSLPGRCYRMVRRALLPARQ
jgi:2-polyprenyl-3-methyl-5-hydroxy-6-metoxy-1,4-benzoquinol methylase